MKKLALIVLLAALIAVAGSLGGLAMAKERVPSVQVGATQSQNTTQDQETAAARGYLGITVSPLGKELAWWLDLEDVGGVVVLKVAEDSPAEAAGVLAKDIITAATIGGTKYEKPGQIVAALNKIKVGDEVVLSILREGSPLEIAVTAAERPQPERPVTKIFPELQGIPAGELFEHFTGGQWNFTDAEGNAHTILVTPGILKELASDHVTIIPNGQTEEVTFTVTENTVMVPKDPAIDSRVVVLSLDDSDEARAVLNPGAIGILKQFQQKQLKERLQQELPKINGHMKQNMKNWYQSGDVVETTPTLPTSGSGSAA